MLEFFTPQQNFDQSYLDTSNKVGNSVARTNKTIPYADNDQITTKKTQDNKNGETDSFAKYIERFRQKENADKSQHLTQRAENTGKAVRHDPPVIEGDDSIKTMTISTLLQEIEENTDILSILNTAGTENNDISQNGDVPSFNAGQIAALNAEILDYLGAFVEDGQIDETDLNALVASFDNKEDAQSLLDMLTATLDLSEGTDEELLKQRAVLEKLTAQLQTLDELSPITSGLTPQEITEIQEQIIGFVKEEHERDEQELLSALSSLLIRTEDPQEKKTTAQEKAAEVVKDIQNASMQVGTTNDDVVNKEHYARARYDDRYQNDATPRVDDKTDPQNAVKDSTEKHAQNAHKADEAGAGERLLSASQNTTAGTQSFDTYLYAAQNTTTATTPTQNAIQSAAGNVITQSQSAAHAHPATQAVSVSIQKAVKAGENTDIKMQLDPPELGRVEVKMSIDKDHKTKIVLTAEKPETYMMLQKDAHLLERAMADAGLSADSGDLQFEMASDNHDFGGNNANHGRGGSTGNSNTNEDADIINSTMTWQVDPNTGHMRYNIMA